VRQIREDLIKAHAGQRFRSQYDYELFNIEHVPDAGRRLRECRRVVTSAGDSRLAQNALISSTEYVLPPDGDACAHG
jgi:hypothetical protein